MKLYKRFIRLTCWIFHTNSRENTLSACLNYFSYFLLTPFTLKWDKLTSSYVIKSNIFQKNVYGMGILFIISTAYYSTSKQIDNIKKQPENVINIFEAIMTPCVALSQVYVAQVFILQQSRIVAVLRQMRLLSNPVSTFTVVAFCSILLACSILNCVLLYPDQWIKEGIANVVRWILLLFGKHGGSLGSNSTVTQTAQLTYYLTCPWMLQYCMPEVLGVVLVISFLHLAQTFQSRLNHCVSLEEGYNIYKEYRKVMNGINELWGATFLILYVADVIYYARAPYVVTTEDPDVAVCIFLLENIVIWGLGAHINKMMTFSAKHWIKTRQEKNDISLENRFRLLELSYEIDSEPMGISCVFFTLTYPFIGSMFGLLVTYALIIYQQLH